MLDDLRHKDEAKSLNEKTIIPAIESLFIRYNIPDERTENEKSSSVTKYLADYERCQKDAESNYERDCIFAELLHEPKPTKPTVSLNSLIWYGYHDKPYLN